MRLTEIVHQHLDLVLAPGNTAVDATAGNGYDTLKMAERVGPTGRVLAIDLQPAAIDATRRRLADAGQLAQVKLLVGDHARVLRDQLPELGGQTSAVTFNLGYLPGSDKSVRTQPDSTLHALDAATELIEPGGVLLVTAYRGHPGGEREAEVVAGRMDQLKAAGWRIESHSPETTGPRLPPILWVATRKLPDRSPECGCDE